MYLIETNNLTKKFGKFTAVDGISFKVKRGEIFGFLGPNGAGKTTTLSMLSTLIEPSSGKAFVNGFSIYNKKNNIRKSIGMVFQDPSLDEELTAYENMDFHGRLYNIPSHTRKNKILKLLALVDLEARKNSLVKTFSGGMKRRLEIARGLLHEPKILFLDEPTLGLDPQTRNKIWDYIKKLNKEKNLTIILTTHYMDEADNLCNKIMIIDHGKIIASGSPKSLKNNLGGDIVTIKTSDADKLKMTLKKYKWCISIKKHGSFVTVNITNSSRYLTKLINIAEKLNIAVSSVTINNPSLEDVFLFHTGKTIREQDAKPRDRMRMSAKIRGMRRR